MAHDDEAWRVTRRNWEKRFLNATGVHDRWEVLQAALDHIDTLYEIEKLKDESRETV